MQQEDTRVRINGLFFSKSIKYIYIHNILSALANLFLEEVDSDNNEQGLEL